MLTDVRLVPRSRGARQLRGPALDAPDSPAAILARLSAVGVSNAAANAALSLLRSCAADLLQKVLAGELRPERVSAAPRPRQAGGITEIFRDFDAARSRLLQMPKSSETMQQAQERNDATSKNLSG